MGKRKVTDEEIKKIHILVEEGVSYSDIHRRLNIPISTLYIYGSTENWKKAKKQNRGYYVRNKEKCIIKAKIYRAKNRLLLNKNKADFNKRQKLKVLTHYSKGKPNCNCCGEKIIWFLSMDHINNDGAEHRKKIPASGLYHWLISNNYPKQFQVLCFNCNYAKSLLGECPHKKPVEWIW